MIAIGAPQARNFSILKQDSFNMPRFGGTMYLGMGVGARGGWVAGPPQSTEGGVGPALAEEGPRGGGVPSASGKEGG